MFMKKNTIKEPVISCVEAVRLNEVQTRHSIFSKRLNGLHKKNMEGTGRPQEADIVSISPISFVKDDY